MKKITSTLFVVLFCVKAFASGHIVTIIVTNLNCNNTCDGAATAIVSGGVGPFSYDWAPGNPAGEGTNNAFSLCAGSYTVTVTDINDMSTATTTLVISEPPLLTATASSTNTSSCGACDGTATLGGSGGTPPYQYTWSPGGMVTPTIFGLCSGIDTITITDSQGCTATALAVVSSGGGAPAIVLDTLININCSGSSFGTINIHGAGGVMPYTYYWSNGNTTPILSNVSAGTYTVIVADSTGCSSSASFTVQNFSNLYVSITSTMANCNNNGAATVTAIGAHPPYSYLWNDPLNQTTATATNLAGGNYSVIVTDSLGCSISGYVTVYYNCYNVIKGKVYNDVNGNCVFDGTDTGIAGRTIYSSGSYSYGYTDANGDYTLFSNVLNNTLTHNIPQYAFVLCPATNQNPANLASMGDTLTGVDFADQYTVNINDLLITFYPGTARPGFIQTGTLYYTNIGTTSISGVTINLKHDSILTYNSSSPSSSSYTYPVIGWNIGALNPGQTGNIYTYFTVPTIPNGGYLGRVLHYQAQIEPIVGDTTPSNNISNGVTAITGSYDPNLKSVSPEGNILATDSILHYTIQFQNTGTDTAFTIVLKDTLSQYLDPSTVEPGMANHPYTFNISFNGELTWTFNTIYLVDSTANEQASHGFATFTVKQKANNPIGTVINNTASIYFDFNPAVVTNTVTNTVVDITTGIISSSTNNSLKVYPNPFSDNTTFIIQSDKINEKYSFELVDVLGKKVRSVKEISAKQFTISRNGLENGIYFYKIYSAESIVGIGKLIIN